MDLPDRTQKKTGLTRRRHWQKTRRLTFLLLACGLTMTIGIIYFARELDRWTVLGWPLSFYLAAQGAVLFYLFLVGAYAWQMRRLDRLFCSEDTDGG